MGFGVVVSFPAVQKVNIVQSDITLPVETHYDKFDLALIEAVMTDKTLPADGTKLTLCTLTITGTAYFKSMRVVTDHPEIEFTKNIDAKGDVDFLRIEGLLATHYYDEMERGNPDLLQGMILVDKANKKYSGWVSGGYEKIESQIVIKARVTDGVSHIVHSVFIELLKKRSTTITVS